jgi:hypothetical protein
MISLKWLISDFDLRVDAAAFSGKVQRRSSTLIGPSGSRSDVSWRIMCTDSSISRIRT